MKRENVEFQRNTIEDSNRRENGRKNNDISKRKFSKSTQNFTILHDNIHSIRSEITGENAQFQNEFNEIRLKIQIEVKIGEKRRHFRDQIWRKFHNFTRQNSLNQI